MGQTTDGKNIYWIGRNLVIIQDLTPIPKGQTQKSALQLLRGILNITLAPWIFHLGTGCFECICFQYQIRCSVHLDPYTPNVFAQ